MTSFVGEARAARREPSGPVDRLRRGDVVARVILEIFAGLAVAIEGRGRRLLLVRGGATLVRGNQARGEELHGPTFRPRRSSGREAHESDGEGDEGVDAGRHRGA